MLIQRVRRAAVHVSGRTMGSISSGLLVFVGIERGDTAELVDAYAARTADLRIFPDGQHNMNRSVRDAGGSCLVVSQFTLAADTRRGRRPSFTRAAPPDEARELYERFACKLREHGVPTAEGVFQATMQVELVNDGPVTILLDPPGRRGG